jgi:putative transposase
MIDRSAPLPMVRQCELLGLSRASMYYVPQPVSESDQALMRRTDELHLNHPFAGARRLRDLLRLEGIQIGRRHVSTLMKKRGIQALYRRPNTSRKHPQNPVFPYLLRGLEITEANHVRAMDITDIPMRKGFVYLAAILDWATRRLRSWRLSNTLTTDSASRRSRKPCSVTASHRSSIPIRAASSPARSSSDCSKATVSGSAWMAKAAGSTTCSSNGGGKA